MRGLSLVVASGGHSSSWCAGLSLSRPLVAEHKLQTRRLSNRGLRAQLLRGMWDLPRPGLEPVSPALAGRFSTTAPPGKPSLLLLLSNLFNLDFTVLHYNHALVYTIRSFALLSLYTICLAKPYPHFLCDYLQTIEQCSRKIHNQACDLTVKS